MTDTQLYLSIGIPSALFALNFIAILWQSRGLERRLASVETNMFSRIDSLEKVMNAKFETSYQQLLRVEGILDARLKSLEERAR
jgi:hypothetical protein